MANGVKPKPWRVWHPPRPARKPRPAARKEWSPYHRSQDRVFQDTFVYVMANFPFFFLSKCGISDETKARQKNVSETTPGLVVTLLSVNLAFGRSVEQFVHGIYKPLNVRFWTGSGRTEWFIGLSPITGALVLFLNYKFGLIGWMNEHFEFALTKKSLWFGLFTPFVWWDGILWLIFFRALKLLFVTGFVLFLIYMVANVK